jgi:hypothetical protein
LPSRIRWRQENEQLNNEEFVSALPTDNHEQHLLVHRMAKNTWAKWNHILQHEEMLSMQRQQEMLQVQQAGQPGAEGGLPPEPTEPQVGVAKQNPMEAAASLRQETLQGIQSNPITQ